MRIVGKIPDNKKFQVGYIAINKFGETGASSRRKGFNYALYRENENLLVLQNPIIIFIFRHFMKSQHCTSQNKRPWHRKKTD